MSKKLIKSLQDEIAEKDELIKDLNKIIATKENIISAYKESVQRLSKQNEYLEERLINSRLIEDFRRWND